VVGGYQEGSCISHAPNAGSVIDGPFNLTPESLPTRYAGSLKLGETAEGGLVDGRTLTLRNASGYGIRFSTSTNDGYFDNHSGSAYGSDLHYRTGRLHIFYSGTGAGTAVSEICRVSSAGINLASGKVLHVAGSQVVGARQAAIAAPDGGTNQDSEARVTIGAILSALRTHGLIAA
jgi:hypothetical protein